ncbi:hypothetical protein [Scleromatobacter humisilvae]|uniref:PEP-CTERM protein-sorting domain-containing protein n=1 Tax=Scleromatobacter humisilvae TaxID=2897159 RepID=A0A9X2C1F8_9BURK|nr:hypothetical protein [Scleromatobacter humisilvae]MCK9685729.1 hypothetical protein [Scleromatobacter humisilvae]
MRGTTIKARLARCLCAAAAWLPLVAGARAVTSIEVTGLHVAVTSMWPGHVAEIVFAGAGGSTSESDAISGDWSNSDSSRSAGGRAFGQVATGTALDPGVRVTASLTGNVFNAGATVRTSAFADGAGGDAFGQGLVGLGDGVSAAKFTLAPGTRMRIWADVQATASVSAGSPFDFADSGLSMAVSDMDGLGLQFDRVSFDALAVGAFGAYDDVEAWTVGLSYENDTDAPLSGLFSGYVASIASASAPVSAVPEPGAAATLCAGSLLLAMLARAMKKAGKSRPFGGRQRREGAEDQPSDVSVTASSSCERSTSSTKAIGALSPLRKPIFRMRV